MSSHQSIPLRLNYESTETAVTVAETDIFKDYSEKELHDLIDQTKSEHAKTDIENKMFLSYIANEESDVSNKILTGLEKLPQDIQAILSENFDAMSWLDETSESIYSRRSKKSLSTFSRGSQRSIVTGTTETSVQHKILEELSPLMKIEMAEKSIKHKEDNINRVIKASDQKIFQMSCKMKEIQTSQNEITQKLSQFQKEIIQDGIDPITGRIPAETFLKFIRAKIKQDNTLSDKLRLRSASLRQSARTIQAKLASKNQLVGILRPVDFEQMMIDKTELTKNVKEKESQFYGLKKVNGQISLACAEQKKALDVKLRQVDAVKAKNVVTNQSIQRLGREQDAVRLKIEEIQKETEKLEYKMKHYTTPSIDDYCNQKETLMELEKRNKVLRREYALCLSKRIKIGKGNAKLDSV